MTLDRFRIQRGAFQTFERALLDFRKFCPAVRTASDAILNAGGDCVKEKPRKRRRRRRIFPRLLFLGLIGLLLFSGVRFVLYRQVLSPPLARLWVQVEDCFSSGAPPVIDTTQFAERTFLISGLDSNEVLAQNHTDIPVVPASLSKLFTAVYSLELLSPEEDLWVDEDALRMLKQGGSNAGLLPGTYTTEELIYGMLVPSGNDAAYALAAAAGRRLAQKEMSSPEAVAVYVEWMNMRLTEDGCEGTVITDPSGDAPQDRTTAADLLFVTKRVLADPLLAKVVQTGARTVRLPNEEKITWYNTNLFVRDDERYYHPRVRGVKTGSLEGVCHLILCFERKEDDYLLFLLNEPSPADRMMFAQEMLDAVGK